MFNEKFFSTNVLDLFAYLNLFSLLFARINIASNKDFTDFVFIRSPLNSFFIIELQPGISVQITGVPQEQSSNIDFGRPSL